MFVSHNNSFYTRFPIKSFANIPLSYRETKPCQDTNVYCKYFVISFNGRTTLPILMKHNTK